MKYVRLDWPEIQVYMGHPDYSEEVGYDPVLDAWFVPEYIIQEIDKSLETQGEPEIGTKEYFDRHDCWDAIGGDWQG